MQPYITFNTTNIICSLIECMRRCLTCLIQTSFINSVMKEYFNGFELFDGTHIDLITVTSGLNQINRYVLTMGYFNELVTSTNHVYFQLVTLWMQI